ncbi:hypothetical protein UlMin_036243 [Ulmus minor]
MKSFSALVFLVIFFVLIMMGSSSLVLARPHSSLQGEGGVGLKHQDPIYSRERANEGLGMELYPTGSSLPDCSHACGPCFPCKRVMVSFKCSVESCPIVYRCMCKGRYYHVPSN